MNQLELIMQQRIIVAFKNNYPEQKKRLFAYYMVQNKNEGNKARSLGATTGVSDLIFLADNGLTYWIELKTATGVQSEEQIKFEKQAILLAHKYFICRTYEEFWDIIGFKMP